MPDRITSMRVFVRIASAGSISAAARALGMSAGMATKHLDALERHLGVKLMHRSTRHLALTEAGSGYLEACERILADLDEADALAAAQRAEVRGVLRMNASLSFGGRFIAPLLPAFAERHPALVVELELDNSRVDPVGGGWDLLIRIGRLADSQLQARRLADCPTAVCAAPAYLARHGTPRRVAELAGHNCIAYDAPSVFGRREWRFGADGGVRVPVAGNLVTNNGEVMLAAALAGQGLIYQPTYIVAGALARGELVQLELDAPTCPLGGIHALYPPDRRPPAKVRAMIDFLLEALQGPVGGQPFGR